MSYVEALEIFREEATEDLDWTKWSYQDSGEFHSTNFIRVKLTNRSTIDSYPDEIRNIEKFCKDHGLILHGAMSNDMLIEGYDYILFHEFYLTTGETEGYGTKIPFNKIIVCSCGYENNLHNLICDNCDVDLVCENCNATSQIWYRKSNRVTEDSTFELYGDTGLCNCCSAICSDCGTSWIAQDYEPDTSSCYDCYPRFNCQNCGELQSGMETDSGLCDNCIEQTCSSCHSFFDEENELYENGMCIRCFRNLDDNLEVFDNDSNMPATRLAIPTIEGRERIRFCGLEIEGMNILYNSHNILAMDLFEQDLSAFDSRRGYHERYNGGFSHIERDSSCDWEAVIGPINMANTVEVRKLNQVIRTIRDRIKDKTVKLSLNCGLHIHVSAEKVGIEQAHNLHLIYTYLEDIMYRLGAAKWPMHRAIINGDHSYQLSPRTSNRLDFVKRYQENRYQGLSFSNYFQRMLNNCTCSAGRFGLFEECQCSLEKCTFEFRVFNTTANTKKIHAYMALTQAMIAKALSTRDFNLEEMPEMGYNVRNFKDMNSNQQEEMQLKWMPRMKFILEELPLTNNERDSILYCVESSEIAPIMGYCEEIVNKNMEVDALSVA